MMLHLLYYLEQLPLSASTSISTADVDVSTNLDESTIEVSLQLIFCLPECLDVPLYLLTNLLQLSIRLR